MSAVDPFHDVRGRKLSELNEEQTQRAYEMWARENLSSFPSHEQMVFGALIGVIDRLRGKPTAKARQPPEPWLDGLPEWSDCVAEQDAGTATPLERFIADNEPSGRDDEREWRAGLAGVLGWPVLPDGAELHATLRLSHRGKYASGESVGDPRAVIQQLIEECSK